MKKEILIFSILLSAVLVWYLYEDNSPEPTEKVEELSELEKELNFYREYAALTGHNTKYAWRLFDAGKERLRNGDYRGAETCFNEFDSIQIRRWWLSELTNPTLKENYYSYLQKRSLKYAEIYENTGRIEEALNIYLENNKPFKAAEIYENTGRIEEALDTYRESESIYRKENFCGTGTFSYLLEYPNKIFKFNFALERYDSAFAIYLDYIDYHYDKSDTTGLTKVITNKLSNYSFKQRDSILKKAYESLKVSIKKRDNEESYSTVLEIFNTTLCYGYQPNKEKDIDFRTQVKQSAWDDFKDTRLYQLLAEKK